MNKLIFVPVFAVILILMDLYVYQAVKLIIQHYSMTWRRIIQYGYWFITIFSISALLVYNFVNPDLLNRVFRNFLLVWMFIHFVSKLFAILFMLVDDLIRLIKWMVYKTAVLTKQEKVISAGKVISRSEFLTKTAIVAGTIPAVTMGFGIISGAYNYQVRKKTIYLPHLPASFDGMKIGQLSDIHSGSFYQKVPVQGGISMFLEEKPDIVFFTGDLVNSDSSEVKDYINVFNRVKAPLGVFSVLGNHDYGDYKQWPSTQAKKQNLQNLYAAHREMGWDLLLNENRTIRINGEAIGVIGVENWGKGRFQKYGNLSKAYQGTEELPVKLLLSHDPSHWDAQVRTGFQDIDVTFSGHTHGFQFGLEIGDFKWSPSQYIYEQWAGLYRKQDQYIYVNRGFGFLGFPGRIGIWPEITVIELKRGIPPAA